MSSDEGVRCWSSTESEDFAKKLTDYPFKIEVLLLMHRQSWRRAADCHQKQFAFQQHRVMSLQPPTVRALALPWWRSFLSHTVFFLSFEYPFLPMSLPPLPTELFEGGAVYK